MIQGGNEKGHRHLSSSTSSVSILPYRWLITHSSTSPSPPLPPFARRHSSLLLITRLPLQNPHVISNQPKPLLYHLGPEYLSTPRTTPANYLGDLENFSPNNSFISPLMMKRLISRSCSDRGRQVGGKGMLSITDSVLHPYFSLSVSPPSECTRSPTQEKQSISH